MWLSEFFEIYNFLEKSLDQKNPKTNRFMNLLIKKLVPAIFNSFFFHSIQNLKEISFKKCNIICYNIWK